MSGSSNTPKRGSYHDVLSEAWDNVVGGLDWAKSVFMGEFADNRSLSAIIADMLLSFTPMVVIGVSARDALAVILRMAKYPEKREDLMEWVLLCACLITVALPLVMAGTTAAAGVAIAGVGTVGGAVVGGIAGSELGAALRAVMLLLIKASTRLTEILQFLQKFMKGNILQFVKAIQFGQYGRPILSTIKGFSGKLIEIVKGLAHYIDMLPPTQYTRTVLIKLAEWESSFYAVQTDAIKWVPKALAELDARLAKALVEVVQIESHVVPAGAKAPVHSKAPPPRQEVRDVPGRIFRDADDPKPSAGSGGGAPIPPPQTPNEKQPRKYKPDQPSPADAKANHKVQEIHDPAVEVAAAKNYKTKNMMAKYEGEHLDGNKQWRHVSPNAKVKYLTPEELGRTKLFFRDGKAYDAKGSLFDTSSAPGGRATFVMDALGDFYASDKAREGYFHHSSFMAGKPVAAAGEIESTEGILTAVSDRSGHYEPESELLENAMKELEGKGVEMKYVLPDFERVR